MKQVYLVQTGQIHRPLNEYRDLKLTAAVSMNYMGSAEFEWGALPMSLRAIESSAMALQRVPEIMSGEHALWVYHPFTVEQWAEYLPKLLLLREDKLRLKEYIDFELTHEPSSFSPDYWWEIENHVMWSFDKEFMRRLAGHLTASFNHMNEEKARCKA